MKLAQFYEGELPVLADVVTFCNNLQTSLYADATVVKSPEVVYRGLRSARNRFLAEEFLLNFRRSTADLGVMIGTSSYSLPMAVLALSNRDLEETEDDLIQLPEPQNERAPIGAVIRTRRSIRRYSGNATSLRSLSTLLHHSAGITGRLHAENVPKTVTLGGDAHVDLRAAISGGALYPIDIFLVALRVDKLPVGAYRYLPKHHALKPVSSRPLPEIKRLAEFSEIEVENACLLIGYVYNLFENSRKYGDLGMGFAFIEVGAIAAHVHLLCTALGLGSCDVGGFSKPGFERLFDADGITQHMIHLTVVGKQGTRR